MARYLRAHSACALRRNASVWVKSGTESQLSELSAPAVPHGTFHEGGAKNAVESVLDPYSEHGASPDLDSARGLIPAVVLGVAFWTVILGIALLIWG